MNCGNPCMNWFYLQPMCITFDDSNFTVFEAPVIITDRGAGNSYRLARPKRAAILIFTPHYQGWPLQQPRTKRGAG